MSVELAWTIGQRLQEQLVELRLVARVFFEEGRKFLFQRGQVGTVFQFKVGHHPVSSPIIHSFLCVGTY